VSLESERKRRREKERRALSLCLKRAPPSSLVPAEREVARGQHGLQLER